MARQTSPFTKEDMRNFTRKNRQLVSNKNKRINRGNVLSSGRELPSAKNNLELQALTQQAWDWVETRRKHLADIAHKTDQLLFLKDTYKRQPERLLEHPNFYILPQELKTAALELETAKSLYEPIAKAYKRTFGRDFKPKANINEPI